MALFCSGGTGARRRSIRQRGSRPETPSRRTPRSRRNEISRGWKKRIYPERAARLSLASLAYMHVPSPHSSVGSVTATSARKKRAARIQEKFLCDRCLLLPLGCSSSSLYDRPLQRLRIVLMPSQHRASALGRSVKHGADVDEEMAGFVGGTS